MKEKLTKSELVFYNYFFFNYKKNGDIAFLGTIFKILLITQFVRRWKRKRVCLLPSCTLRLKPPLLLLPNWYKTKNTSQKDSIK